MTRPRAPVTHLLYLHGFPRRRCRPRRASSAAGSPPTGGRGVAVPGAALAGRGPRRPRHRRRLAARDDRDRRQFARRVLRHRPRRAAGPAIAARCCSNPAVDPARDLARYVGELGLAQQRAISLPRRVRRRVARPDAAAASPARTATSRSSPKGDEVLDWREMSARYDGCHLALLEGSDHALSDFEHGQLAQVLGFLGLAWK